MAEAYNGGPAFPSTMYHQTGSTSHSGASLRDWFAFGLAPTITSICRDGDREDGETVAQYVARRAYEVADVMIAEREKSDG